MSLFDGVKGKLGFGNKSDWQDNGYDDQGGRGYDDYPDDGYDDGYDDQEYLDGPIDDDYVDEPAGDVVSFDAYNPDKFENVKLGDRAPRVASYDSLGAASTSGRSHASAAGGGYAGGATSNVRPLGPSTDRGYGSSSSSAGSWGSSGDSGYGKQSTAERSRQIMDEISAQAAGAGIVMPASAAAQRDPYQSLGNDFIKMNGDPSTHLAIVRPTAYSDVEKIANSAKAGKSVVLVVQDTKPALAKRILDFSFGVASALNQNVDKAADRVFVISKGSEMLSKEERAYLVKEGVLKK